MFQSSFTESTLQAVLKHIKLLNDAIDSKHLRIEKSVIHELYEKNCFDYEIIDENLVKDLKREVVKLFKTIGDNYSQLPTRMTKQNIHFAQFVFGIYINPVIQSMVPGMVKYWPIILVSIFKF